MSAPPAAWTCRYNPAARSDGRLRATNVASFGQRGCGGASEEVPCQRREDTASEKSPGSESVGDPYRKPTQVGRLSIPKR